MLTHRASGVVNFAHGALGVFVAYSYYEARETGALVLPILGLPARVPLAASGSVPTVAAAFTAALLLAAAMGLLSYVLVFRPLRSAPPLARVVASLGLLLYLQATARLRFTKSGAASFKMQSFLPDGGVEVLGVTVPVSRFALAGIAIVTTVALWAVFRYTRFGLVTRASAESEKGALLLGHSPDRIATLNWVIAALLAGASVILVTGMTKQLDPLTTSLLVVPALAAALLGGLTSFSITTTAALGIGMAQSAMLNYASRAEWIPGWLPRGGMERSLPFLVILAAMTLRGRLLPSREAMIEARLPRSPTPRGVLPVAALLGGLAAAGLLTLDSRWRLAIVVSTIGALIALSSVVLTGYVGQISLAQYALAGVAAFTTAKLATTGGVPFPLSPLLALAITVAVGLAAGLPAVRIRGMTLAIATIGAAAAIQELFFNSSAIGGLAGQPVPRPGIFGLDLGFSAPGSANFRAAFGLFALAVLILSGVAVANLRRSATGLRWLAVRANERAAAASGVDVAMSKLSAFAVASLLAGMGGVLLAYQLQPLSPDAFMVYAALALLALTYLGGIASIGGAIVAGLLTAGGVLERLNGGGGTATAKYQFAISGIALIVVAIVYPDGVTGALHRLRRRRPQAVGSPVVKRDEVEALGSPPF